MVKCCELGASKLKHRATLQHVVRTEDGQGGFEEDWADEASLWMSVEPLSGYERMQSQQLQTPVTHRVILRHRAGVTTAKRIRWGDRIFEIKEALNVEEANRWLRLKCVETEGVQYGSDDYLVQDGTPKAFQDGIGFRFMGPDPLIGTDDLFLLMDGQPFVYQDGIAIQL